MHAEDTRSGCQMRILRGTAVSLKRPRAYGLALLAGDPQQARARLCLTCSFSLAFGRLLY